MRSVNDRQLMTLIAALLPNVDLDQLNLNAVKATIDDPKLAGEHLVRFINAGCRMPEQLVAPADPPIQLANMSWSTALTPQLWCEENGVIYFTVTSDGTTGEAWIARLEGRGKRVDRYAKSVLRSYYFVPSPAGTVYHVVVLKGESLTNDNKLITSNILAKATMRGLIKPHAEVACLIRCMFTDNDIRAMSLSRIVAMHDTLIVSAHDPSLLGASCDAGGNWLGAYYGDPRRGWDIAHGFAFQQV